jgi:hypothetical protein
LSGSLEETNFGFIITVSFFPLLLLVWTIKHL